MKLSCEIIQDLLPLYEDNLCGNATRAAVEAHLTECEQCRMQIERIRSLPVGSWDTNDRKTDEDSSVTEETENRMDAAVSRSFHKIRRRWLQSLLCAVLILPVLIMSVNQYRGVGICFTNLDDIWAVSKFAWALERGDFEKASACMDYKRFYQEIQELVVAYPDTDGAEYTTVVLGQEEWVATDNFFGEHLRWEENDENIWGNIIYNHVERTMIPIDVWERIIETSPDCVEEVSEEEWIVNGEVHDPYVTLETKWGIYVVSRWSGLEDCVTADDFCEALDLIPAEIFEEGYPEMKEQALAEYQELQERYAEAKSMTLEEFTEVVQSNCIAELAYCEKQGISFKSTGYQESYYISENGYWVVTYGLLVDNGEERIPITVSYGVRDGKILLGSSGYREYFEAHDVVHDALSVYYTD